ncbi:beta-ketoacyl-[acyl-carrier-protein] synthase family protein [Streptomyces nitrosporeus]|uniref:beta-ketoacyl-[acyl-carrier-protein] synthase family protein n=1 Tax=Streptomyces nitrosporeus TaxID=28894 RepID=UPI0039A3AC40
MNEEIHPSAVITGIGAELSGASGVAEFWIALRSARPGVRALQDGAFEKLPNPLGAVVDRRRPVDLLPGIEPRFATSYSDEILLTMAAMEQARQNAGLSPGELDPQRIGIAASSSRGPLQWWCDNSPNGLRTRPGRADALLSLPGAPASLFAVYAGIQGQVSTLSSACVGGHQAIGWAAGQIAAGSADAMIVVGHEFPLVPDLLHAYNALGVLSSRVSEPETAMRPYSLDRDGFALGEGAVALVLENPEHAERRGARIYATVLGQRSENEAAHATSMDATGMSMAGLVTRLLARHGVAPADLSYVCGHASSTGLNDRTESRMMAHLFTGRPRSRWAPLGGNKPVFGHTLGASGIVNAAACALMTYHQELAPTRMVGAVDPDCDHDHVAEGPRRIEVRKTLSLSFALGSQSSALLMGVPS